MNDPFDEMDTLIGMLNKVGYVIVSSTSTVKTEVLGQIVQGLFNTIANLDEVAICRQK